MRGGVSAFAAAGLVALFVGAAPAAQRAEAPRLEGKFDLRAKVIESTPGYFDHGEGEVVERTWKLLPRCPTGACEITRLRRQIAGGHSNIRLTRSGDVYKGTEVFVQESDGCVLDGRTKIKIKVSGDRQIEGELRASKFTGRWVVELESSKCAPGKQVAKLHGTLHSESGR